jgi:beta-glucosidase
VLAAGFSIPPIAAMAQTAPAARFPADFLWGAATAGHQVEGNNVNSDV